MELTAEELAALKTANPKAHDAYVKQQTELADLKKKATPPPADKKDPPADPPKDDDLEAKAKLAREAKEKSSAREKRLEAAVKFNMQSKDFLKQNEALLPQDAAEIFEQAEKEKFEDAVEKDEAIKAGLVQAFFRVQTNVDLLTAGQKAMLDDYLKLTKTGKQEKAQYIYDMIFEPAFDTLKRQKKAEALSRGHGESSDADDAYRKRLVAGSRKHYLGEKNA